MGKLGYSSITLTDLTNTLPVSLVLESSLDNNAQVKTGTKYTPDFSGKGVIITPSLFLGQEEIKLEDNLVKPEGENDSGYIYYEIGNTKYHYKDNPEEGKNYVDDIGCLHIIENLTNNITIEAYIEDFKVAAHDYEVSLVTATNPISILLLEEGTSNYQAVIECEGGREHFEDTNSKDIIMTAALYKGNDILNYKKLDDGSIEKIDGFSYFWEKLSDGDSIPEGNELQLTVKRANIVNREYYTCTITEESTGLVYTASQFIYDFTDEYNCSISYDRAPVLTDTETEIKLEAIVFKRDINITEDTNYTLTYSWYAADEDGSEYIVSENNSNNILILNETSDIPRYKDFVLYCKVYHTDEVDNTYQIAGATLLVHYTVDYSVKISPQTIFIPSSSKGVFQGKNEKGFSYHDFSFQILDTAGNPMIYSESESLPGGNFEDGSNISFISEEEGKWNFKGTLKLDLSPNNDLWVESNNISSKIYEFNYTFLGQVYTEEITVVKSFAGEQGVPAYTVALSNDFHAFSGGEGKADFNQRVELDFSAFFGDKPLEITKIFLTNDINEEDIDERKEISQGLYIERVKGTEETNERKYILSTATDGDSSNFLTKNGTVGFSVTVKEEGIGVKTFYKSFQYIINFNGKSYYLMSDINTIKYNSNGKYSVNQINISAFYRDTNGAAQEYSSGRIRYSFNNGENWITGALGKVVINLENGKFYNSIIVELYSAKENSWDSSLLLERETINVLVSLEGVEIGGENLLPRTKDLALEEDLWKIDEIFSIEKDNDFSVISCNVTNTNSNYNIYSSKVSLKEEFFEKTFCFSFLIYSEDWNKLNNLLITAEGFKEIKDQDEEFETRECYNNFGFISRQTTNLFFEEDKVSNKWLKVYQFFNLSSSSFIQEKSSIENCEILRIVFTLEKSGQIKIKKPKLEIGNIPTDWSSAVNDFLFSAITGLEGNNLKEILTNYLTKINNSNDRLTLTVGNTTITSLKELEEYLSTEIGQVKTDLSDTKDEIINSHIQTLKDQFDEITGTISQIKSYINLGYENDAKRTPYLLLGTEDEGINTTMKVTNEKMIFQVGGEKDFETTLSNQYLDTNRIRTRDGVYIGKTDYVNNSGTGYLVISTTEQGVGFKWMNVFSGG